MADVNTGIGPFLAIYLTATRHWNPASVGIAVAAQSIASVAAQGRAGWLVDWSDNKKRLIIGGAAVVVLGCIGIVWSRNEPSEILTQVLIGMAAALFPPSIAAISLGAAAAIRSGDIDNRVARAANEELADGNSAPAASFRELRGNTSIWIFTVSVLLFHFANAAMLPLVGELLSKGNDAKSSLFMSACIIAAQFVMIPVAFLTGKLGDP